MIVAYSERRSWPRRGVLSFDLGKPTPEEQRRLWQLAVDQHHDGLGDRLDEKIERLVGQFYLSGPKIRAATAGALGQLAVDDVEVTPDSLAPALWHTCRVQARPRLESLAQRIESAAGRDDLVLPPGPRMLLGEIARQVRFRTRVHECWGFAARGGRGLGIAALFAGVSGTGKTLAAEVIAADLELDLYRIDLSAVISKYIGETEKNLERIFAAAEDAGAVLLFDEADALFGRRTEIRDSHDRYANVEVSYLLQRMESYRGLAVLTSNLKESIDQAFLRRFRFIVDFPFPDAAERREIWRRALPSEAPAEAIDADLLAELQLTGGSIRNVALGAAFFAAAGDRPITVDDFARAAQRELTKIGQPIPGVLMRAEEGP